MFDWLREYQYRTVFRMSHEEFLAEPVETIEWLLRIDGVVSKVRNGK